MIFGGIQKTSLIDFPSKISCVLFTAGCNFHCPYCHNPELVRPPFPAFAGESIFDFLERRKSLIDGVVITGGEPTLHPDLPQFCDQIKKLGLAIKLDTNGSHPEIIQDLIKNHCIDYIAMDIKTLPENYVPDIAKRISPETIYKCIQIIKSSNIAHEFRTTCIPPFITTETICRIAQIIQGADLFVLQNASLDGPILNPEFIASLKHEIDAMAMIQFKTIASPFVKRITLR